MQLSWCCTSLRLRLPQTPDMPTRIPVRDPPPRFTAWEIVVGIITALVLVAAMVFTALRR